MPPQAFGQSLLGSMVPTQGEYIAIEEPPLQYDHSSNTGTHAMASTPPTKATVNALHVKKYGGGGWHWPRATGARPIPIVLAYGLAEAQMTGVMANIPMPKYGRNPENLDEFERT